MMRRLALMSVFLAAAVLSRAQTPSLDPHITGLWIGASQPDPKTPPGFIVWMLFPNGTFVQSVQQPGPQKPLDLVDSKSNQSGSIGTFTASNGSINLTPKQGSIGPGAYVLCDDYSHMIVRFKAGTSSFLFFRYGSTDQQGNWHGTTVSSVATVSLPCLLPPQGQVGNLLLNSTAHWVDVGLAGVWVNGSLPSASNPNPQVSIWLIHPDGSIMIHKQNISASQPMAPNSSAHDVQTSTGYVDIFGGRFCFSSNGATDLTGAYTLSNNGNQISLMQDGGSTVTFKRVGYFNLDGSAHIP
jgi:hypothetical protein